MTREAAAQPRAEDVVVEEPFEVRRRVGLYVAAVLVPLAIAGGFGWLAWSEREPVLWAGCGFFALLFLISLPGLLDVRTPLFVADAHGIRLRVGRQWVGLLWREMAAIHVEPRVGRHDPCIKVVSPDGSRIHRAPVGFATTASVGEAEVQLARRQAAAAY
ncbi:hypothetical protein ACHAAC_15410 [Aeromicrobium sp. CF4.19]|uniref:hypothetical protein n=1 Tax=Aeromicrobium sp. CF4.19 TaxID=3373082 RepID=UPI003EE4DFEC